jgi:hypothetical protein
LQKASDSHNRPISRKKDKSQAGSIHVWSFRLLNKRVQFLYPKLSGLEKTLKHAMMPIAFEVYVSVSLQV